MASLILVIGIVMLALLSGAAIYYLQVYAYYESIVPEGETDVMLTSLVSGTPEPIIYDAFEAITATSSPIRYRACFTTPQSVALLSETYEYYENAEPLLAPSWFNCFDAKAVGVALENEEAVAFLGEQNIEYGIDRVVAILPDGRGFVWHQINECGAEVFDGKPVPEGCPEKP